MKKLHLNETSRPSVWRSGMSNVRRLTTCTAIVLAGMLASCSEDDVDNEGNDPVVPESNTVSLELFSGASQAERVKCVVETKAIKKERLMYVGTILPLEERKDLNWSATAVTFNEDGTKAYITWHSNKQATKPADKWGGAIDVLDLTGEKPLEINTTAESKLLKFNHVFFNDNKLFLSSTSAKDAGVVGRVKLTNGNIESKDVDCIGFPGMSVNAVAQYADDKLVAISGYTGTYGMFAPDATAQPYYYGDKEGENIRKNEVDAPMGNTKNFGGKYVTTDEDGTTYILYNSEGKDAKIKNLKNNDEFNLGVTLTSKDKVAETYDYETEEWTLSKVPHNYYGKHVFAVRDGIAYIACGYNHLLVYDLNNGPICSTKHRTTGVCVDEQFVYAATEIGLQIYDLKPIEVDGEMKLHRYAYEMATYNETTGEPTSTESPKVGEDEHHSPNFVAVNPKTKEIFVAYGQSGVRVYKFNPEAEKQPEVTE